MLHLKVDTGPTQSPGHMTEKPSRRIFVTGVNAAIGNHIVKDLLENGTAARGSVRDLNDPSKTDHVRAMLKPL